MFPDLIQCLEVSFVVLNFVFQSISLHMIVVTKYLKFSSHNGIYHGIILKRIFGTCTSNSGPNMRWKKTSSPLRGWHFLISSSMVLEYTFKVFTFNSTLSLINQFLSLQAFWENLNWYPEKHYTNSWCKVRMVSVCFTPCHLCEFVPWGTYVQHPEVESPVV